MAPADIGFIALRRYSAAEKIAWKTGTHVLCTKPVSISIRTSLRKNPVYKQGNESATTKLEGPWQAPAAQTFPIFPTTCLEKNKISCRTRDSPEIDRRSIYCRHSTEPGKLFFPVRESISVSLSPTSRGIFPSCCVFSSFSCDLILACCCWEGGGGCAYSAVFLAEGDRRVTSD